MSGPVRESEHSQVKAPLPQRQTWRVLRVRMGLDRKDGFVSVDRELDTRVERSAVLAVERSLLAVPPWITAHPVSDFGTDLVAFRMEPFKAVPVQVKGARSGLTVWRRYGQWPIIMAYVVEPLSDAPLVSIMTGEDAWRLPVEYVARGGRASDHKPTNDSYRWPSVTGLLRTLLQERTASAERWDHRSSLKWQLRSSSSMDDGALRYAPCSRHISVVYESARYIPTPSRLCSARTRARRSCNA